jgi:hypothetical protein
MSNYCYANKDHRCIWCSRTIRAGELYCRTSRSSAECYECTGGSSVGPKRKPNYTLWIWSEGVPA